MTDSSLYLACTSSSRARAIDSQKGTHELPVVIERLGLPRQRFHDLRHAYATLTLEAREDLAVVSRSLGHSPISATAGVYAHLTPAMHNRAAARMDGILRGTAAG